MTREANTDTLIHYLVESLVDNPESVEIDRDDSGSSTSYMITVHPDDVGKVIGRQGRIIKSLRTLMRAAGSLVDEQVDVDVNG